ncbi:DUF421 domain-containing protein [Streptacidiphilus sp. N1-3]|uniref:DUF421 domain-containing protein n=1 Tax=Streptacidiphilus alkalitolerans TaxID=3342712 RepID=A0ABV6WWC1_9ACTN
MWHDLWSVQVPIAEKVIRTVLVYALLLVLFRVAGKRGLANLNTFDFVVIFLLSNVVQNAIIGADNSLLGGVIGAVTLVVVNAGVTSWLARDSRAERLLEGTPTTVIEDGAVVPGALRKLSLRSGEIEQAVRLQNGDSIDGVALGSLGPDGQLVITLKRDEQNATRGDVEALQARLAAIEELLAGLAARP